MKKVTFYLFSVSYGFVRLVKGQRLLRKVMSKDIRKLYVNGRRAHGHGVREFMSYIIPMPYQTQRAMSESQTYITIINTRRYNTTSRLGIWKFSEI